MIPSSIRAVAHHARPFSNLAHSFVPRARSFTLAARRTYAVQAPGAPTLQVFSRRAKWLQKERHASNAESSRQVDYLRDEVAFRLCERLLDINRRFPHILDLGAGPCSIAKVLSNPGTTVPNATDLPITAPLAGRVDRVTAADSSRTLLYRDADLPFNKALDITRDVLSDEELLPYEPEQFDAVLSSLSLHWINDLPSVLKQINNVLKPDAPFMGVMLGGDSLFELRTSLQLAEQERLGGVSNHTSPLADVRDVGGLLQGAGFKLLTVDVDDIVITYPTLTSLLTDLQSMGESNATSLGAMNLGTLRRDVLLAAEGIYKELHGEVNEDSFEGEVGSTVLPATFRLIYMIGWKEGEGQERPLPRGSGMVSIKDVLEKQGGNLLPGQEEGKRKGEGEGEGEKK